MNVTVVKVEDFAIFSEEEMLHLLGGTGSDPDPDEEDKGTETPGNNRDKCTKCDKCDKCFICF